MSKNSKGIFGDRRAFTSGIPFPEFKLFAESEQDVEESKASRKKAKETKQNTHNYFKNKAAEVKHWLETHKSVRKFQRFLLKVKLQEQAEDARLSVTQAKADSAGRLIDEATNKERELIELRFEQRKQSIAGRKLELQERKQLKGN